MKIEMNMPHSYEIFYVWHILKCTLQLSEFLQISWEQFC